MQRAIDETNRRREIQLRYNEEHGITPETVRRRISDLMTADTAAEEEAEYIASQAQEMSSEEITERIAALEKEMYAAAEKLEFERAAELRDEIEVLRETLLQIASDLPGKLAKEVARRGSRFGGRDFD